MKYWAFISYSHRDAKVATALQRALETYRLPRALVGRDTPVGPVPDYLKPVFRDRAEMQAGTDLQASVRKALAQSAYLIVVCSPDAARSPWVNQEIVEFKRLAGESRVLAVIANGEPFASRMPGREADECFPVALRFALTPNGRPEGEALEPVAADLRPDGDGERLALLKLVGGMIGVGVDGLVRRDAQRRARRMAIVAAASLCGMAVTTMLTVLAVKARNDAQTQRAQAESLIEFMLVDLRKRLNPVGKLDLLDSLGEKALAYYSAQDADRLDAGSLGRRSRAMHLVGEIREQRGQLDEALAAFTSAADTTATLLDRAPNDGKRIFDHAQSVYWVGYIAWQRGQREAALRAFLEYRALAQRLVHIDPANADWQMETAYASQNLGVVQLDGGRADEALRSFSETRNVLARLAPSRPALTYDAAENQGWIAKALEAANDYEGALAAQRARLTLLVSTPDATKDRQVQQQISNANYELGRLELALGQPDAALSPARAAADGAEALVASDTSNFFWLSESAFDRLGWAEVLAALGQRDAARAAVERSLPEVARLIASDATVTNWQVKLRGRALSLQYGYALADDRRPPLPELRSYLDTVRRLEGEGTKLSPDQVAVAAGVCLTLGDFEQRDGRSTAAAAAWREAAARAGPLAERDNLPSLTTLGRVKLRLGEVAEARTLAARVAASKYRHPAYGDLVAELAAVRQENNQARGR